MTPRPVSRPLHPSWVLPLLPQFTSCLFWGVSEVNAWPQTHELGRALSFEILASGGGPTPGVHAVSAAPVLQVRQTARLHLPSVGGRFVPHAGS